MGGETASLAATVVFRGDTLFVAEHDAPAAKTRFTIRWPHAPVAPGDVVALTAVVDGIARVRVGAETRAFDERGLLVTPG